jgi:hypothetical protein
MAIKRARTMNKRNQRKNNYAKKTSIPRSEFSVARVIHRERAAVHVHGFDDRFQLLTIDEFIGLFEPDQHDPGVNATTILHTHRSDADQH